MVVHGQVALVTGAGRGIGRGIAQRLAADGMKVALVSRTEPELEETKRLIDADGGKCMAIPADVVDERAVNAAFERARAAFGPVELAVNNAARFNALGPVWEVATDDWWRDVTVNLKGVFLRCRAALAQMRPLHRGRIINLIGGGTGDPFPYGSGYGCSKAAVMRLTECLAKEASPDGVSVFALGPGLVRTAMTELQLQTESGRRYFGRIRELFEKGVDVPPTLAAEVASQIASGRFDALTGRAFYAGEDLDALAAQANDVISNDRRALRLT